MPSVDGFDDWMPDDRPLFSLACRPSVVLFVYTALTIVLRTHCLINVSVDSIMLESLESWIITIVAYEFSWSFDLAKMLQISKFDQLFELTLPS